MIAHSLERPRLFLMMARRLLFPMGFFLGAFLLRAIYALYVTPIDWNWDSYHHWQIAYYTLNIGLKYGRMWDLMGVEYYWPPLPLLTQSLLIRLFGTSLWNMRVLNMLIGSASAALAYRVGRHRSETVGILFGTLLAAFPILAFHDILALNETIMVFFTLLGLLMLCQQHDFYAGAAFGAASTSHFAAYPLFIILVVYELLRRRGGESLIPAVLGYGAVMGPYLLMLRAHTGDWLYMFRIIGFPTIYGWEVRLMYAVMGISMVIPGVLGLLYSFLKKKVEVLLLFSFSELLFYGGLLTVRTPPLFGAERYYMLLSVFVSFLIAYYFNALRSRLQALHLSHMVLLATAVCAILTLSLAPRFISYQGDIRSFFEVADWIGPRYQGGTIVSELPMITYRLVHHWHIRGDLNILGAHYSPLEHDLRAAWLREHNVTWIIYSTADFDYTNRVFPELRDGRDHGPFILAKSWGEVIVYRVIGA